MAKSMQIMDFLKKSCFSDPPKYAKITGVIDIQFYSKSKLSPIFINFFNNLNMNWGTKT